MDAALQRTAEGCHQCASLRKVPMVVIKQSIGDPPEVVGALFAADVLRREHQFVLVAREYVPSFTMVCLIDNERKETHRQALV